MRQGSYPIHSSWGARGGNEGGVKEVTFRAACWEDTAQFADLDGRCLAEREQLGCSAGGRGRGAVREEEDPAAPAGPCRGKITTRGE